MCISIDQYKLIKLFDQKIQKNVCENQMAHPCDLDFQDIHEFFLKIYEVGNSMVDIALHEFYSPTFLKY